jgi:hypothetical protein
VQAQIAYQNKVPLHQEITVKWSEDAAGQQSSTTGFVLAKRWQHMKNSAKASTLKPGDPLILVVATTPGGEVRALALCVDTRSTSGQIDIQLPQDGQISKLTFLSVGAGHRLENVGQVEVGVPDGTLQKAPKDKAASIALK